MYSVGAALCKPLLQDDKGPREGWRELLKTELNNFNSEYNALMYGGTPITQVRVESQVTRRAEAHRRFLY